MDFEALKTFVAIHQSGGFSIAADKLGRSQPAISRRISLLEEHLGVPLFERASTGVGLSAAGRTLLPHAERILAASRDAERAMVALRGEDVGAVSLMVVGTLAGAHLSRVLRKFAARHPAADLTVATATSAKVSDAVRRGEATIGLRYLKDTSTDLVCEHIASEPLRVVCAPDHALAGRALKSLAPLGGEHWFAFTDAQTHRESFADNIFSQFGALGIGTVRWTAVDSQTAQKRLIEAGFGIALLPQGAIEDELRAGTLATIAITGWHMANPIHTVVRKQGYLSPAAKRLLELLRREPLAEKPSAGSSPPRPRARKR